MQTAEKIMCRICKQEVCVDGFIESQRERLLNAGICHKCDSWVANWQIRNDPETVRINGNHYRIHTGESRFKGMGGAEITIRFKDGRVVHTDNLWHQGTTPSQFKVVLFDNAEFIDG